MKREDVSKIIPGITSDQLDSIMNLHGADITAKVNEITTLKAEKTTLTEQLSTANSKLEGYDPEWKAKAEQAKTDAAAQVADPQKGLRSGTQGIRPEVFQRERPQGISDRCQGPEFCHEGRRDSGL